VSPRSLEITETENPVGLAEHVAQPAEERQDVLVARPRALVIGAREGDVAEALGWSICAVLAVDLVASGAMLADVRRSAANPSCWRATRSCWRASWCATWRVGAVGR
jgi:hypothetical protein